MNKSHIPKILKLLDYSYLEIYNILLKTLEVYENIENEITERVQTHLSFENIENISDIEPGDTRLISSLSTILNDIIKEKTFDIDMTFYNNKFLYVYENISELIELINQNQDFVSSTYDEEITKSNSSRTKDRTKSKIKSKRETHGRKTFSKTYRDD